MRRFQLDGPDPCPGDGIFVRKLTICTACNSCDRPLPAQDCFTYFEEIPVEPSPTPTTISECDWYWWDEPACGDGTQGVLRYEGDVRYKRDAPTEAYTQPMILLRLMFQTPSEPMSPDERGALQARGVSFLADSFLYKPFDPEVDRTQLSVSLPVAFDADGPHLVGSIMANFPGSTGSRPPYDAHLEYRAFRELYEPRDLSEFLPEEVDWRTLVWQAREAGRL